MFSAPIGRDGRRRWSGLLAIDALVVILAALDLGVGVWHELEDDKPASGPALTGLLGGTSATVYFGALCLCWDDGVSPRRLLLLLASFVALVCSALLGAQLRCMDAPSESYIPGLSRVVLSCKLLFLCVPPWCVGIAASCGFLAFVVLRLCGGRAFELAAGRSRGTVHNKPASVGPSSHPLREDVVAEICGIYRQVAPEKMQHAKALVERYPPEQWHQMLRMIRCKYGHAIDTAVWAKTATMSQSVNATKLSTPHLQSVHHNKIGRALAFLLPVCAIGLFDGTFDATDVALNHGLRAVTFLTGPHYGPSGVMLSTQTTSNLRSLYTQSLPTPTAITRPSEEWIEVPSCGKEEDTVGGHSSEWTNQCRYPIRIRLLTPTKQSSVSKKLFQAVDSNADGTGQHFKSLNLPSRLIHLTTSECKIDGSHLIVVFQQEQFILLS